MAQCELTDFSGIVGLAWATTAQAATIRAPWATISGEFCHANRRTARRSFLAVGQNEICGSAKRCRTSSFSRIASQRRRAADQKLIRHASSRYGLAVPVIDDIVGVVLPVGEARRVETVKVRATVVLFDQEQVRKIKTVCGRAWIERASYRRVDVDFKLLDRNFLLGVRLDALRHWKLRRELNVWRDTES